MKSSDNHSQRKIGGTIEPPSNFQFKTTKSRENKAFSADLPHEREHTHAQRAHAQSPILNVLVACEESQAECAAFRALGHRAFSCDIQPCRRGGNRSWHIQGDVTPLLEGLTTFTTQDGHIHAVSSWDLIIAHPPCTYLCRVSAVHLFADADKVVSLGGVKMWVNEERYKNLQKARQFFMQCLNARAHYVAVENPLPLRLARLPASTTYACPSWFGDRYTKKTLYWLRNLPPLMATIENPNATQLLKSTRGKYRARTSKYLAEALARQWSEFILKEKAINTPSRTF